MLVSGSWDESVRIWDIYNKNTSVESLFHGEQVTKFYCFLFVHLLFLCKTNCFYICGFHEKEILMHPLAQ